MRHRKVQRLVSKTLLLFLIGYLTGCFGAPIDGFQNKLKQRYQQQYQTLKTQHFKTEQGHIAYYSTGNPENRALIFIHGTPGSKDAFLEYLFNPRLQEHLHLISIDRPGWGESQSRTAQVSSLEQQAEQIDFLISHLNKQNQGKGVLLLGHSLGASLAAVIAAHSPSQIEGMILLSGALNPKRASPRWYNWFAKRPPINWLLPQSLTQANQEMYLLEESLQKISTKWPAFKLPVIVIQGNKDKLVYPDHANFAEQMLINNTNGKVIRLPQAGHFTPWENQTEVIASILQLTQSNSIKNNPN